MPKLARSSFAAAWNAFGDLIWRFLPAGLSVVAWVGALFAQKLLWPFAWAVRPSEFWHTAAKNCLGVGLTVVAFVAFYITSRANERNAELEEQNNRLKQAVESMGSDYYDIWHHILSLWAKQLEFSGNERISLYRHSGGKFLMLGRFSTNPVYNRKGRGVYPLDEGCIGQAWADGDGHCFSNDFPEYIQDPEAYATAHEQKWKLDPQSARGLGMKSRAIFAVSVNDLSTTRRQAIIVYESMNHAGINREKILKFHDETAKTQVALFMKALKNQEPSLEFAAKEGF